MHWKTSTGYSRWIRLLEHQFSSVFFFSEGGWSGQKPSRRWRWHNLWGALHEGGPSLCMGKKFFLAYPFFSPKNVSQKRALEGKSNSLFRVGKKKPTTATALDKNNNNKKYESRVLMLELPSVRFTVLVYTLRCNNSGEINVWSVTCACSVTSRNQTITCNPIAAVCYTKCFETNFSYSSSHRIRQDINSVLM